MSCYSHCVLLTFAAFDIRIPPNVDLAEFESTIQRWCTDAGPDVTYQFALVSCTNIVLLMH